GGGGDSPLLLVVLLPEVSEVVDGEGGPLISVVDSRAVLVMVSVVVVDVVSDAIDENDGSTNSCGAFGKSSCRVTYMAAAMRMPMTAMPRTLAPTTAAVELCQGADFSSAPTNSSTNSSSSNSSSRSGPATATDISPGTSGNAGSAQLGNHLGGE